MKINIMTKQEDQKMDLAQTMGQLFWNKGKYSRKGDPFLFREGPAGHELCTFEEYQNRVLALVSILKGRGCTQGTKVALVSSSQDLGACELALLLLGSVILPLDLDLPSEAILKILSRNGPDLFLGDYFSLVKKIPELPKETVLEISQLRTVPPPLPLPNPETLAPPSPQDPAYILPLQDNDRDIKEIFLTQKDVVGGLVQIKNSSRRFLGERDRCLYFLPPVLIFSRKIYWLPLVVDWECYIREQEGKNQAHALSPCLIKIRPSCLVTTSSTLQGLCLELQNSLAGEPPLKQSAIQLALDRAALYYQKIQTDLSPSLPEILEFHLAQKFLFSELKERLGGKLRLMIQEGTLQDSNTRQFFQNLGLPIFESYGIAGFWGPFTDLKGIPLEDIQIQFGPQGEILVKSQQYFPHDWFHTGLLGRFDPDGHLEIISSG